MKFMCCAFGIRRENRMAEKKLELEPGLSVDERVKRLFNVSIKNKDHLKKWLEASGRRWLVFEALDLVDALPWTEGVDDLMRVVACYRNHRSQIPTGRVEVQKDPTLGKQVEVPTMKTDLLEIEELDRCIRNLIRQASEKDPTWKLDNPPL